MPTNEDRKEVARELRELASNCISVSDFDLAMALDLDTMGRNSYWPESVEKLADLIEPEKERTCFIVENDEGHSSCSVCGAHYLCMTCASYCPDSGSKVVE